MLPKINGFEVCSQIRKNNFDMPIIMLTAKGEESDIILGLNLGADDYVTKPFSIKELLARAEALMRRRTKEEPEVYKFGNCQLDVAVGTFTRDGRQIKLTQGEFKMLHLFLRRAECTLTCDEIRNTVWGYSHFITLQDIDRTVTALRKKVESDPNNPMFVRTIEGIGYKFEMPEPNGNNPDN
jgi:DNA-binding response OmpR family regulator